MSLILKMRNQRTTDEMDGTRYHSRAFYFTEVTVKYLTFRVKAMT